MTQLWRETVRPEEQLTPPWGRVRGGGELVQLSPKSVATSGPNQRLTPYCADSTLRPFERPQMGSKGPDPEDLGPSPMAAVGGEPKTPLGADVNFPYQELGRRAVCCPCVLMPGK